MVWELISAPITLSTMNIIIIAMGWVLSLMLFLFIMMILLWTPASAFLSARFSRSAIAFTKYRDGTGEFMKGKQTVPGTIDVKKVGPINMIEGSHTRERISGVPIFEIFAESSTSIPKEYAPIIEELKEMGFEITSFEDYRKIIELTTDAKKCDEYIKSLSKEKKEKYKIMLEKAKKIEIKLMPYKTYKMYELATMFPFGINPVFVEQYSTAQLIAQQKKHKYRNEMLLFAGFGVLIMVIAAVIAFKFITGGSDGGVTENIIQITPDAARILTEQAANETAKNSTIII